MSRSFPELGDVESIRAMFEGSLENDALDIAARRVGKGVHDDEAPAGIAGFPQLRLKPEPTEGQVASLRSQVMTCPGARAATSDL